MTRLGVDAAELAFAALWVVAVLVILAAPIVAARVVWRALRR